MLARLKTFFLGTASVFSQWLKTMFAKPKALSSSELPDGHLAQDPAPIPKQNERHACEYYTQLKMHFRDIGQLNAIGETLGRDFLTAMPDGAYKSRLDQISFIYRRIHEDLSAENNKDLLEKARAHRLQNQEDWDNWDVANFHEMEQAYRRAALVPPELLEERSKLVYEGRRVHRDVLKNDDWEQGRDFLRKVITQTRRIAELQSRGLGTDSPYEAMLGEYTPGFRLSDIEGWFKDIEGQLTTMLPKVLERQKGESKPIPLGNNYPAEAQMWLNRSMLKTLGFDFTRGGLYETGHNPVEGGTPEDTRLVIKDVDTGNFLDSLKSALHEGGHGIYIQGLPRNVWRYQPVAMDLGAAMHESQALLIEMLIGRMPEFFQFLAPRLEGLFQGFHDPSLDPHNLWRLKTRVKPSLNRKQADEITYFFHILLRFKLEQQLIDGSLMLDDLPEAWNAMMEDYFDLRPETHAQGCLQDVHWFVGKFGYFPAYALGHMIGAQWFETLHRVIPNFPQQIAAGQFGQSVDWLRNHIYARGRLLSAKDLIKEASGQDLSPKALIAHLRRRYL